MPMERDEIHRSFRLPAHASVQVAGIDGEVEVETAPGEMAEVRVTFAARSREALEAYRLSIEATPGGLVVRGAGSRGPGGVRLRVWLRVPRQVELRVNGVAGGVVVGEVEGSVRLSGIVGDVRVGRVSGSLKASGVNGGVSVALAALDVRGARLSGINGAVELRIGDELNADLQVGGLNGEVVTGAARMTLEGWPRASKLRGRIGSGGALISLSGINGRLSLPPA
ncbi:MAG TPA: hypothetical protein VN228_12070 [Pyrinomonadaceae bacterium]|nr:hypothetical protein [Pyrinomonadaceae bacterium]